MKKLTKILVLLLSVALICTGALIAISAAEAEELDLSAAADGKLVLDADAKVSSTIEITESLTIDLAGHSLTSKADLAFKVVGDVDFAIIGDGDITADGCLIYTETADIKLAGLSGMSLTLTDKADGEPLIYTAGGNHSYLNINVTSKASASDIFSVGGNSNNKFLAMTVASSSNTEKDNNERAAKSVISMRDGTTKLSISYSTIDVSAMNAIKLPENTIRIDDFVLIDNCRIATTNAGASNGSGARPAFLAGDVSLASDIIVSNSFISYANRVQIKANSQGSALVFKNTKLYNCGNGDPFFEACNVRLEDKCIVLGISPATGDSSYADKTAFFAAYNNPGSMSIGPVGKANLVIGKGTCFDSATYAKIVNRTADVGDTTYKYYDYGQVVFDNGEAPTDLLSGQEGVTSYKIINDFFANFEAPFVVVDADTVVKDIGDMVYYDFNPYLTTSGALDKYASVTTVTKNGNSYWNYYQAQATNSTSHSYYFPVKIAEHGVIVLEMDISAGLNEGDRFPTVNFHLNSTGSGKNTSPGQLLAIDNAYTSVGANLLKNGEIKAGNFAALNDSGTAANREYANINEWNRLTFVIDTSKETGTLYCFLNGYLLGISDAYAKGADTITGINFAISGNKVGARNLILDNAVMRTYDAPMESTDLESIKDKYIINGGLAWNSFVNTPAEYDITVGGIGVADFETALKLNRETGAVAHLQKDIKLDAPISEGGMIFTNGYEIYAPDGSMPAKVTDGLYHYDAEYDIPVYVQLYMGEYLSETEMADESKYSSYDLYTVRNAYNILNVARSNTKLFVNNYYKEVTHLGWALSPDADETISEIDYNLASANIGKVIKLYPVFDIEGGTTLFDVLVLKADGTVDLNRSISNAGEVLDDYFAKLALEYGETLILQKSFATRKSLDGAWKNTASDGNNDNPASKTISIDLNGYTLTCDPNYKVQAAGQIDSVMTLSAGETLNLYSTFPGGKIANYGVMTMLEETGLIEGTTILGEDPYGKFNPETGSFEGVRIVEERNGKLYTVEYRRVILNTASGGAMFTLAGGDDITLNVGRFGNIPGTNLTLEASAFVDAKAGGSTCEINVDGANITSNAADKPALFVIGDYDGRINVKNSVIVNPLSNGIISASSDGESATGDAVFDNCIILVNENGKSIFESLKSLDSILFTSCLTNGKFEAPKGSSETVKVMLGGGNTYGTSASTLLTEGTSENTGEFPVSIGAAQIVVNYFTIKTGNDWMSDADDYTRKSFTIIVGDGEADLNLPKTLPYKTLGEVDYVTLTYVLRDGTTITETYLKGSAVNPTPAIPDVKLNVAAFKFTGKFDKEVPEFITENITVTALYELDAGLDGIRTNVALYSDFGINIYIPRSYEDYITSMTVNGEAIATSTVTLGGIDYITFRIYRPTWEAADSNVIAITVKDGEYTLEKTLTISVAAYARAVIDSTDASVTENDKALMRYVLKFVQASVTYFGKTADESLNELLSGIAVKNYDYMEKAYSTVTLKPVFDSIAVVMDTENLAFVFVMNESFGGDLLVTFAGKTYTEEDIVDGKLIIDGFKLCELAADVTIGATDDSGKLLINNGKYNLASYLAAYSNASGIETGKHELAALEALYSLAVIANEYK